MLRTTMATLCHLTTTSPTLTHPRTLKHFLSLRPRGALQLVPKNSRFFTSRLHCVSSAAVPQTLHSHTSTSNADIDPCYLSCSMPDKRLKVAVLLSGGVDSSVALRLLHSAGHSCTAFYLKIWFQVCFLL